MSPIVFRTMLRFWILQAAIDVRAGKDVGCVMLDLLESLEQALADYAATAG